MNHKFFVAVSIVCVAILVGCEHKPVPNSTEIPPEAKNTTVNSKGGAGGATAPSLGKDDTPPMPEADRKMMEENRKKREAAEKAKKEKEAAAKKEAKE